MHPIQALRNFFSAFLLTAAPIFGLRAQQVTTPVKLRVMTYNIHHANPPSRERDSLIDLKAVARAIRQANPDLVALQEVDVHNTRAGLGVNEAETLAQLTGMHWAFTRAMYYRGGEYGDAVLSRFPIADTLGFQLPIVAGTPEEIRSLCVVKVTLPDTRQIYFASTHLGLSEDTRVLQAHRVTELLGGLSLPVILCGDMNAHPDSRPMAILDSAFARSCTSGCALTIPAAHPRAKIDYILFRPRERLKALGEETVPETYASDHLPVVADLQF